MGSIPRSAATTSARDQIHIRTIGKTDFADIQELARRQPGFTEPSRYLLDALSKDGSTFNLVATGLAGEVLGYILALRSHPDEILLWQLATTSTAGKVTQVRTKIAFELLSRLANQSKEANINSIQFTMHSASVVRWARQMVRDLWNCELRDLKFKVNGEAAYEIRLGPLPSSLMDVYNIPGFPTFVHRVFNPDRISDDWLHALQRFSSKDRVLEIGAGTGRLTAYLLKTGARVVAVEPNMSFDPRKLALAKGSPEHALTIIRGYFPDLPAEDYSAIVLHQNVFLELANQMDESELLRALRSFLRPAGVLLFDYVADLDLGAPGSVHGIYSGAVPGVGDVRYDREYIGSHWGNRFETLLRFSVCKSDVNELHARRIEVRVPPLDEVCRQIGSLGGSLNAHPINAFTFFPGQPHLVSASFNST